MLSHKSILVALVTLSGLHLQAETAGTNAHPEAARLTLAALDATVRDDVIAGNEKRQRVLINAGDRRLMLIVPFGLRTVDSDPAKIVVANRSYSCVLSFRIAVPGRAAAASLNADLCREWLSARLGDIKIQDEFSLNAANQSGPAFEFHHKVDGVARSSLIAFIPSPVGVLEFSLLSTPDGAQAAKSDLLAFMRSFRISDANGKLEILTTKFSGS